MGKIDELIQQYCPDGVGYVQLGEVCEVLTGGEAPDNAIKGKEPIGDCKYPIYSNGIGENALWGYAPTYRISKTSITFSSIGTIGFPTIRECCYTPIIRLKVIYPKDDTVLNVYFLKYVLEIVEFEKQKSSVPNINANMIKSISIPLPPLPVQEAIVNILDRFAVYAAELQAELQARQQQYNYYRDTLLSFEGRDDVQWVKLEQVFELRNGYTPSKNNKAFWDNGTIPWYRMEDIRQNGRILKDSIQHITPLAIKGKGLFEANTFIIATTATIGEHALLIADSLANQQFTNLKIRESLKDKLDVKFVFYYLFVVDDFCKNHVNISGFASVDMEAFKRMQFPIPPLSEQQRIVDILDRFDTLTNDLTQGLPAEIEARQQQYEYYRDRLLTFKRKSE